MNPTPDVQLVLREWLADDGDIAPDRILVGVADRIARQPQRARRLPGRPLMNGYTKLAAGLAAVLVVGIVGWQLLPRSGGLGGTPTPPPTPTPAMSASAAAPTSTPTPEAFQCEEGSGCAGLLTAGTHRTAQFSPSFGYVTPDAWMNPIDVPTIVGITPIDRPADLILVWSQVVPAEKTATCDLIAVPGVDGTTVDDWIAYLDGHAGLDSTNVQSLTVGGLPAQSIDVRAFGGWASPCAADRADFNVPLLKTPDGAPGDGYGVRIGAEARFYVIDVGDEVVVVTVYAYGGGPTAFADAVALGEPVVKAFDFTE